MSPPTAQQALLAILLPLAFLLLFTLLRPAQYHLRSPSFILPFILAAILIAISAILSLLHTHPASRFLLELLGRLTTSFATVALLHPAALQKFFSNRSHTTVPFLPHHHIRTSTFVDSNETPSYRGPLPKPSLCWVLLIFVAGASIVSIFSSLGVILDPRHPIPPILCPLLLLIACIIPTPFLLFTFSRILNLRGFFLLCATQAFCAVSYIIPCFQPQLMVYPDTPGIRLFGGLEVARGVLLFLWISTCMLLVYLLHVPNSSIMAPSQILSEMGDNVTSSFMHTAASVKASGRMSMSTSTLVQSHQSGGLPVHPHSSNIASPPQGHNIVGAHWNWPGNHNYSPQQSLPSDRLLNPTFPPTSPGTSSVDGDTNDNNANIISTRAIMMPVQIPPSPSDDFLVNLRGDPFASCPSSPVPTFSSLPPTNSHTFPSHLIDTRVTFAVPATESPALASSSVTPSPLPPSSFSGSASVSACKVRKERSHVGLTNLARLSKHRRAPRSPSTPRMATARVAGESPATGTETKQGDLVNHHTPELSTFARSLATATESGNVGRIRRVFSDPVGGSSLTNLSGARGTRSAKTSLSSTRSRRGKNKARGDLRDAAEHAEDVAFLARLVQNALDSPDFLPGGGGDVSTSIGAADTLDVRPLTPPPKAHVEMGVKRAHEIGIGLPIRSSPITVVEKEPREMQIPSHRRSTSAKLMRGSSIRSHNHGTPHPDSPFRSRFSISGMPSPLSTPFSPYSSPPRASSARKSGDYPITALQLRPSSNGSANTSPSRRRPPPLLLNLGKISSNSVGSGSGAMNGLEMHGVVPVGEEENAEDPPGSTIFADDENMDVSSPNLADVSDLASLRSRSIFSSISTFASSSPSPMIVGSASGHSEENGEPRPSIESTNTISSVYSSDLIQSSWDRRRPGVVPLLPAAVISVETFGPIRGDENEEPPFTSQPPAQPSDELSNALLFPTAKPRDATGVVDDAESVMTSHMTHSPVHSSRSLKERAIRTQPPLQSPLPLFPRTSDNNSSAHLRDSLSYIRESSSLTESSGDLGLRLGSVLGIPHSFLSASAFKDLDGSQATFVNIPTSLTTGTGTPVGHHTVSTPLTSVHGLSYPYSPNLSPTIVPSSSFLPTAPEMDSPASVYFSTFSASSPIVPSPATPYSMFTSRSSPSMATTTASTPLSSPDLPTPRTPHFMSAISSGNGSSTSGSKGKKWILVEEDEGEGPRERGEQDANTGYSPPNTIASFAHQEPQRVSSPVYEGANRVLSFFSRSSRPSRLPKNSPFRSQDGSGSMSPGATAGGTAPGASLVVVPGQRRLGTANSRDSDLAFELQEFGVRSPDGEDLSFRRETDRSDQIIEGIDGGDAESSRRRGLDLNFITEELGLNFIDERRNQGQWIAWR